MTNQELGNSPNEIKELIPLPVCTHHWIIDSPIGPISKGVCKICGEQREFCNQWRPNNSMTSGWASAKSDTASKNEQNNPPTEP